MNNYEFYISLFSSIFLFFSEILPFLPCKSNGILHSFFSLISDKNSCIENTNNFIEEIEKNKKNTDTQEDSSKKENKNTDTQSEDSTTEESKNSSHEISVLIESDSDDSSSSSDEDYEILKKRLQSILIIIDDKRKYDHNTKLKINYILKEINNL